MKALFFLVMIAGFVPLTAGACDPYQAIRHDSFRPEERSPFGARPTSTGAIPERVRLRLRTCATGTDQVRLRIWTQGTLGLRSGESWQDLRPDTQVDGDRRYWSTDLTLPQVPALLYYFFEIKTGGKTYYYVADAADLGGEGQLLDHWDDMKSFQLSVYDRNFRTPDWIKGAVVYQIFPDRFRDGDPANNDASWGGGWYYGKHYHPMRWNQEICDPESAGCRSEAETQFYGGDLKGITEKLPQLAEIGVTALYMTPIFAAVTNHRYDTQDYFRIDPRLGTLQDFRDLAARAESFGIHLILDGVFNHVSSDSRYFDYFSRWNADGELTSPGGRGAADASGACESTQAAQRKWFYFPAFEHPAGERLNQTLSCGGQSVESYYGSSSMIRLNPRDAGVRDFFFNAPDPNKAVGPYWLGQGASAWRFDVGQDVDGGAIRDPGNRFWEDFRTRVKGLPDLAREPAMIGEYWGNASGWLLGNEWDSVMNYRFRYATLDWLYDGCTGNGCRSDGGFEDEQTQMHRNSTSQFVRRLDSIRENYPAPAWHAMLNLVDSHDTNRALFLLRKGSNDDLAVAREKLKLMAFLQYSYPGSPMVYYGDEVGLEAPARFHGGRWKADPFNRAAYPWRDRGLNPDDDIFDHYRKLARLRREVPVLSGGEYENLLTDDARGLWAFRRFDARGQAIVVLNRDQRSRGLTLEMARLWPDGHVLHDPLDPSRTYVVNGGKLVIPDVAPLSGRVLE